MSLLLGKTFAGRYRIDSILGKGSFGAAYKALDKKTGDQVVVKHYQVAGADASRWQQERDSFKLLYPELLVDAGVDGDGFPFMVMKWMDGRTADKQSAEVVEPVIRDVLGELKRLHEAGVAHNDIKPDNIWVRKNGRSYLLDFGQSSKMLTPAEVKEFYAAQKAAKEIGDKYLAADFDDRGTGKPGDLKFQHDAAEARLKAIEDLAGPPGSADFAAPGRAEFWGHVATPADRRSDVYEVGATTYYMLEGKAPPTCGPQTYGAHVPAYLQKIMDKSLACEANDRYQTADAMLAALKPHVRQAMGEVAAQNALRTSSRR